ncbi:family 2A encapsulin nanocompartment cargo protein cysteine desulfurase [Granulicella aggregans]|jgi:cysteine desulfurase/selenocysteine lyase|uniref:family 2A encapsulin nanocompartment cargo protein cysteine desulfurase n=1 Tax=Granulicella aggregans TaxID=474949 RepID=UPI00295A65A2|nr:family 2A encapsulin nanocompartment cargo protein cysteine desulfurase [Granulicella aggregans]
MSTSDQDKAGSFSPVMIEDVAGGELPAGLPDVAALAQMANEFFRSAPGQAGPFGGNQFGGAQSAVTLPSMAPQFGATPSSFAPPSAERLPSEADVQRLSGSAPSAFELSLAAAPVSPNPSSFSGAGFPQSALADTIASPFSQPMPVFDLPFPNFEAALPAIPRMAALPTEADVTAALNSVSSFYFLEDAGALSKPTQAKADRPAAAAISPSLLPDLQLPRKQFDVDSVRRDFPILQERVNGKPLIWLDNAATTQKPQSVIDRISYFYEHENSNIHRAAHELAARATDAYEGARQKVARFLNAPSTNEIVFVRGATEAINLVAKSWGKRHIGKDDEIIISWIEHHANIVPWQMLAAETGARLRVAPVDDDGQILLDEFEKLLNPKTRLVSVTQVSNALGTITPTRQIVQMAHRYGARVLVDGAQSVSHMSTDVQALDCDFFVFSGHKVFGPTGIGVLYGKPDVLADTPPWQGGGNMIVDVTFEKTIYHAPPARFEAGTGNIADAVGLGAAIDYVEGLGMENIARHEHDLLIYATKLLQTVPGLRLIGTAKEKASVMSFVLEGYKTEEVGAALNKEGIAVRSGHHCAQPALRRFGVETSVRPSLALYNNYADVDALIAVLRKLKNGGA